MVTNHSTSKIGSLKIYLVLSVSLFVIYKRSDFYYFQHGTILDIKANHVLYIAQI